jgi:uncharacterized protein with PIN domain
VSSRIEDGYREKFRTLLARVRPKRLQFGVDLLMDRARQLAVREGVPLPAALARLYEFTRWRVQRRLDVTGACSVLLDDTSATPRFLCDTSLGGLARWLRAAGYEAEWLRDVAGDALIAKTVERGSVLLTTDSRLWDRRALRDGQVKAQWISCHLNPADQAGVVLRDLGLELRQPRCMACGGRLAGVSKDEVSERIPPRTALWKDDYFVCSGCGKLFWRGTHWERIAARLQEQQPLPTAAVRP